MTCGSPRPVVPCTTNSSPDVDTDRRVTRGVCEGPKRTSTGSRTDRLRSLRHSFLN